MRGQHLVCWKLQYENEEPSNNRSSLSLVPFLYSVEIQSRRPRAFQDNAKQRKFQGHGHTALLYSKPDDFPLGAIIPIAITYCTSNIARRQTKLESRVLAVAFWRVFSALNILFV